MKTAKYIASFLNIDYPEAKKIRRLIMGTLSPDTFESVQSWCRQCYNEPPEHEKIMAALNEASGGYGVEAVQYGDGKYFEYVNMGDSYATTIIYDNGRYIFTTWGDYVGRKGL